MVALLMTILVGCGGSGLRMQALQPLEASLADEIISSLNSTTLLMGSFKASLTLSIASGGTRQELRGYLRYKHPDKLRLDLLGVLNELRAVIIANGDDFLMLLAQEKEAISDKLSDELLERVFGIKIRVSDVRGAVLANPIFGKDREKLKVGGRGKGEYAIRFKSERMLEEVWVKELNGRYVVSRWIIYDEDGEPLQDTSFSSYSLVDGLPKPLKVTVLRAREETKITFSASNPQVNTDIPDSIFSVEIPPGVAVRRI
jgi:outer membrane lipoprotein-sorting protein